MRLRLQIVAVAILSVVMPGYVLGQQSSSPKDAAFDLFRLHAAFGRDGRLLRVVGVSQGESGKDQHVRAVTYSASTGAVIHAVDLQPDTDVVSVTTHGETAIVSAGESGKNPHFYLLDTATGHETAIPDSWLQKDSDDNVAISGDGRLVSVYSENDSDTPMTVTVYNWQTKTLVARRTSAYVSAGGFMDGGVTEDGEVEFEGNRVGSTIVELKTGRVMAEFGPSAVRSPDGKRAVQFPNLNWDESSSTDVLVKDGKDGRTIGKLDLQLPESEQNGGVGGVFCGTRGQFVVVRVGAIAVYSLNSGKLLAGFPAETWRDAALKDDGAATVACSEDGTRVAIYDGARLTFHDLKQR